MPLTDLVVADTPAALVHALDGLADVDPVGVDVERADWDRYWRAAALVQVGGRGRVVLVDPLALDDLSALHDHLAARTTVLHAMENDLGPLRTLGVEPPVVHDTAVAAAVLGLPTGLETLLASELGVALDSDKAAMQRADWEVRPLSPEMMTYAAADVADLPALWEVLAARLAETGRDEWYAQELAASLAMPPVEERREWTRTKGAGRLDDAARSRLRALWDMREDLAKRTDTAPGRIAGDRVLIDLAVAPPTSTSELSRRGLRRQAVRDFGAQLIAAITAAEVVAVERPRRGPRPVSDADREVVDRLRTLRAERAKELGIDAGLLCPSRTLLGAVLTDATTPESLREALGLRPWQWSQLGFAFCEVLGIDGPGVPTAPERPVPATDTDGPGPTSDDVGHEIPLSGNP